MSFRYRCQLRWSDLDAQGHVNNVKFLDYLQDSRVQLFHETSLVSLLDGGIVVTSHEIDYLASIGDGDSPIEVEIAPGQVGASRFELTYRLFASGRLCARARTTMCPYDFQTKRPRRLSASERDTLAEASGSLYEAKVAAKPLLGAQPIETEIYVRWSDLDSYGHVNNVAILDYIMQARIEATTAIDPMMARPGTGYDHATRWVVAHQDVVYLKELSHRIAPYPVFTSVSRVGNSSVTLTCQIGRDALVRSSTVLVSVGPDGRPIVLSEHTRSALRAHACS